MAISFSCKCGQKLQAPEEMVGRKIRCNSCQQVIIVPGQHKAAAQGNVRKAPSQQQLAAKQPLQRNQQLQRSSHQTPAHKPGAQKAVTKAGNGGKSSKVGLIIAIIGVFVGFSVLGVIGIAVTIFMSLGSQGDEPGEALAAVSTDATTDGQSYSETYLQPQHSVADDRANAVYGAVDTGTNQGRRDEIVSSTSEVSTGIAVNENVARVIPDRPDSTQLEIPPEDSGSSAAKASESTQSRSMVFALEEWHSTSKTLQGALPLEDEDMALQRFSWMTNLLPHMGYGDRYDQLDLKKSWMEPENLVACHVVVPQFINPADDRTTWEGYPYSGVGLTHFVGMSGYEEKRNDVAAKWDRSHPNAGIFGYEESASIDEITDGTSNTIMVIGSGELAGPWAAGGGATIRGARRPHFDEMTGFGSKGLDDEGVITVMADGSIRHLSKDIDPEVFRALTTIHGDDQVDSTVLGPEQPEWYERD